MMKYEWKAKKNGRKKLRIMNACFPIAGMAMAMGDG